MEEPFAGSTKMDFAASAVNDCVYEIVIGCTVGNNVHDRCQLGLIGYGDGKASILLGGFVSDVAKLMRGQGVWIDRKAKGDTPMHLAFDEAAKLIREGWLPQYPDSFPPYVFNITDGKPTFEGKESSEEAEAAAQRLTSLTTSDGKVLLFNAHISPDNSEELVLPAKEPPKANEFMRFLFRISSPIPAPMHSLAQAAGLNPAPGSRGCLYNAGAEALTKLLLFGSIPAAKRAGDR